MQNAFPTVIGVSVITTFIAFTFMLGFTLGYMF